MRRCTRRMRSPVPFFSSPLLALQVLHGGELRPCSPAQGPTGPQGQSQTQWAKQLAQKFAADAAGQRYGGQVTQLCEEEGFPVGSIALVHKAVRALEQLDAALEVWGRTESAYKSWHMISDRKKTCVGAH